MSELLAGKKVAFLVATEGVEQVELTDPWEAVVAENARPSIVSTESGTIQHSTISTKLTSSTWARWSNRRRRLSMTLSYSLVVWPTPISFA
ncbi:hypothetical protein N806_11200 [Rhodococcus sp. P27]|nr:hypothetical protein N806_11200 [Rhodococcus sp. P27]